MHNRAIRVDDWKLVAAGDKDQSGPWELYNLKTDRAEMHDLAGQHPEQVARMAKLWQTCDDEFRREAGPPDPLPGKAKRAKKPAKLED